MLYSEEQRRLEREAEVMEVAEFEGLDIGEIVNRAFDIRLGTLVSRVEIEERHELINAKTLEFKSTPVRRTAHFRFWRDALSVVRAIKELKLEREKS